MRAAALLALLLLSTPARAEEIVVSAAASLVDAMREIAAGFGRETGHRVRLNLAGSNTLAAQIERGAPADLFLAADEVRMDLLERRGFLVPGSRRVLLGNALVLVTPSLASARVDAPTDLARPAFRRIALADPEAVPAGVYAKAFLERAGIWTPLAGKIIPTEDVRACLAAVESGAADAGIVYRTDARVSDRVNVAWEVPPSLSPRISYPVALVRTGRSPRAAHELLDYLGTAEAAAIFEKWGFLVP